MSSKGLRYTLVAGLAVVSVLAAETNPAFAQNRPDGWTLGPSYGPGGAYDIVAPGMYVGDYSGPTDLCSGPRDHQRAVRSADKRLLERRARRGLERFIF
jgi:hypothetical protein